MTDNPEMRRRLGEIVETARERMAQTRAGRLMAIGAPEDPMPAPEPDPDLLAIIRRIKRRAEVMRLDAARPSTARQDAEEIRILAEMAEKRLGGAHA